MDSRFTRRIGPAPSPGAQTTLYESLNRRSCPPLDFRYAPLADKLEQHRNMSRWANNRSRALQQFRAGS
jgi:hypothetical protein